MDTHKQQLVDFIRTERTLGKNDEDIAKTLFSVNWSKEEVEAAFLYLKENGSVQTSSKEEIEYVSSFTYILQVVLIIVLFILFNKAFGDIKNSGALTFSQMLIRETLFVLPVIALSFVVHSSIGSTSRYFRSISIPYFLISGWIFLRFFWQIIKNIFDKNAQVGIYVALLSIIVLITLAIFIIQKHNKTNHELN